MSQSVPSGVVVHYSCSDDQPMAESEFQLVPMLYALNVLRTHVRGREDLYVDGMIRHSGDGSLRPTMGVDLRDAPNSKLKLEAQAHSRDRSSAIMFSFRHRF